MERVEKQDGQIEPLLANEVEQHDAAGLEARCRAGRLCVRQGRRNDRLRLRDVGHRPLSIGRCRTKKKARDFWSRASILCDAGFAIMRGCEIRAARQIAPRPEWSPNNNTRASAW